MRGNVVVVFFADDLIGLFGVKDFAQTLVVSDVLEVAIFHEIDEARKLIEDGDQMVLDLILLEKSVVLHGEEASMEKTTVGGCFWLWAGTTSFFVCFAASFFSRN